MSIRARLTIGIVALLLVILGVLGAAVVGATRSTLIAQVDATVVEAAQRFEVPNPGPPRRGDRDDHEERDHDDRPAVIDSTAGTQIERPVARMVYGPDGALLAASPSGYPDEPDPLPDLDLRSSEVEELPSGGIITVESEDDDLRYRAMVNRLEDGFVVVTAAPLAAVEKTVRDLLWLVGIASIAALGLAALGSSLLVRRGLQPIDRMIDTAAAIGAGDLSQRVDDADPRTELGRLGNALNEMLGQIERAADARAASEERLRRFVGDAAHELRTPLTSLRGYAELYRQGAMTDETAIRRGMGRIESEAIRMSRLVDDLLLLAKLDQQRELDREPIDLGAIARDAAQDFRAADPARPLQVDIQDGVVAAGDQVAVRQVIDNLLANARVHTPEGTPVSLTVRTAGREAEVVVADEGPGIPPDARTKIFERFGRVDPGRSRATGGSGLGLAIVVSLVASLGGSVTLDPTTTRGARFVVRLPLAG